ncbi:SDR family NAD(P)-dependent oxidoreductase [Bacillus mesophilum]|uniref:SDR family oxidoreductase n=1 Tax=Bacillus mesophilum TaxID=1071718 RepID=A0A7V7RPK7_9BACI|nr:SDR family NAD(P)-dependent oxidoreductase [Bacillus mesophilum]KAB2335128.1 SDR family oxidoreductase [Bacillus mesophilum]
MAISDVTNKSLQELMSLKGRTAVVTGGASGFGLSISKRLAEAGANVIVGDLNEEAAKFAVKTLSEYGGNHYSTKLDVSDAQSIKDLTAFAVAMTDRLDIWVNNAGIYPVKPILEITDEDWETIHKLNLTGVFIGSREAAKVMIERNIEGVIINIISLAAFKTSDGYNSAHYVSTKHGVAGLTKSLATELGPKGIRAVAITPALSATDGINAKRALDKEMDAAYTAYEKLIPLGRLGLPDDVARVAVFAASDMAKFVSGSTIFAEGGDGTR